MKHSLRATQGDTLTVTTENPLLPHMTHICCLTEPVKVHVHLKDSATVKSAIILAWNYHNPLCLNLT